MKTKMTKKLLLLAATLLLLVLTAIGIATTATATAVDDSGSCGENVTYTFDAASGTLTISGTGDMADYWDSAASKAPWYSSRAQIQKIVIEEGVTSIGDYAFQNCSNLNLSSITIPNSIKTIGKSAFCNCQSLTYVAIGNNVTNIGAYAFSGCYGVININIPESMIDIGAWAFQSCFKLIEIYNCSDLTITVGSNSYGCVAFYAQNVYTPISGKSNLIEKNGYIFYNDTNIAYLVGCNKNDAALNLPSDINGKEYSIYQYAFYNFQNADSFTIPNGVTSIGNYSFFQCNNITSIAIPNSVENIGSGAFSACRRLKKVSIGNSVISIGDKAFSSCENLSNVILPNSIATLGNYVFGWCNSLETIYYFGTEDEWNAITKGSSWNYSAGSSTANKTYTIEYVTYGDADGDSLVDLNDAVLVQVYLANMNFETGISSTEVWLGADANGDGTINLDDAVLLATYLANFDYDTGTSSVVLGKQSS